MSLEPVNALPGHLLDLARLDDVGREFERAARSEATWSAYESDMRHFMAWCEAHQLPALPASEMTVARYLTALADMGRKPATIRRRVAAISVAHGVALQPNPCRSLAVRDRLAGISRTVGTAQREATPVTTLELRKMVAALRPGRHGTRDRLILLLGFAAALRRSELAALNVEDIRWVPEGMEVSIRRSKTDQEGEGAIVPVPYGSKKATCPVRALGDWLDATNLGGTEGPLIWAISRDDWMLQRITPASISRVIARAAKRAGLDPNGNWTGHSLRAGLATSAAKAGVPDRVIMATTRHKSRTTLDRYVRAGTRWDAVAAANVGL